MVNLSSNEISRDELKPGDHIYSLCSTFLYAHHGIYIGDNKVIHFAMDRENGQVSSVPSSFATSSSHHYTSSSIICLRCSNYQGCRPSKRVIMSCLDCFLSGKKLYLFSYSVPKAFFLSKISGRTSTMAKSDRPHEVIHRATYIHKNGFESYNLLRNNCEDFAIYCKTGLVVVSKSSQNTGRNKQISWPVTVAIAWLTLAKFEAPITVVAATAVVVTAGIYLVDRYMFDMAMRNDVVKMPVKEFVRLSRAV